LIIDPLANKVFNASGEEVAHLLTEEIVQWLKDTSILWIQNLG